MTNKIKTPDYITFFDGDKNENVNHIFDNGITVIANMEEDTITVMLNGEVKNQNKLSDYTVEQYERFLLEISQQ